MRRSFLLLLSLLMLLLLASCATTDDLTLVAVPEKSTDTFLQGSRFFAAQTKKDVQMIVGVSSFSGRNATFSISLASTDGSTFDFRDDYITIYGGNKDKKKWELIQTWSSLSFIKKTKRQARAAVVTTGILGTLAVVDSILNQDDYYTDVVYSSYNHFGNYSGHYGAGSSVFIESNDPLFTTLAAIEATVAVDQLTDIYQAELENTIIQCPTKTKLSSVTGEVTFSSLPKYADYKIVFNNGHEKFEFYFTRSDRDDILHPWADKQSELIAMNITYSPTLHRHNLTIGILSPDFLGFYAGLSVYNDEVNESTIDRGIGLDLGLNYKIADYTWLQAGIDLSDMRIDAEFGDLMASLGLNIAINDMSFYGGTLYSLMDNRWFGEFGIGVALF